jgi:hypothetical protein
LSVDFVASTTPLTHFTIRPFASDDSNLGKIVSVLTVRSVSQSLKSRQLILGSVYNCQVTWVYTRAVDTTSLTKTHSVSDCDIMADVVKVHTFGDRAIDSLPSYSVSFALLALVVDSSVSVRVSWSGKDTAT